MARIYPFRALRYDISPSVHMEDVVTQPYDKISPEPCSRRYYERSPKYNLIRVILGKKRARQDTEPQDFLPAGPSQPPPRTMSTPAPPSRSTTWRAEGHPRTKKSEPALYGYSQTYTWYPAAPSVKAHGETRERRGFIALGHLYDYADQGRPSP